MRSRGRKALTLALAIACGGKVSTIAAGADAGAKPPAPMVAQVAPQPGTVDGNARFTVTFSAPMNEGMLLAASGRSETVVLAQAGQVEQVAAALAHDSLSAAERALLVPASAQIGSGHASITIVPDGPLAAADYYLLVSPRLKDDGGDKLQGSGARFEFTVQPPPVHVTLLSPPAGAEAPLNLSVVRAAAAAGRVALVSADGTEVASAQANGTVALALSAPPAAGARYFLSLDGAVDASQGFIVGSCARTAPPALQGGTAALAVRDDAVTASLVLDWPVQAEVQVGLAADGDPCGHGACLTSDVAVSCAPPPCGPQQFVCSATVRVEALRPAADYALRVVATDDFGHSLRGPVQTFSTLAPLPRLLISEVMATPAAPQTNAEYVELVNLGPGAAALDRLGFMTADGTVRPLSAAPPPVPILLAPGGRAIAAGSAFDAGRYPSLPAGVPILRASTQRLLSNGLSDAAPQAFRLVTGAVPVELSSFPGGGFGCAVNQGLQRDEAAPILSTATWRCGRDGGTPGAPP